MVTEDLNAPPIATTLTAALFIMFMGIAPMVWASLSEHFHIRRVIYLAAMLIFTATSIGAVFVQNIWALVAVRCIQSIGVSSGQSVGSGYISDLYPIEERGAAFGKYMFGAVFGPLLGPILGGFLVMSAMGWRATFMFCFVFGAFIFIVIFLFLPETFRDIEKFDEKLPMTTPDEDVHKSHLNRKDPGDTLAYPPSEEGVRTPTVVEGNESKKKRFNPFAAFKLLRHVFVLIPAATAGMFFGSMFATETIMPEAFKVHYGLTEWQIGLCYLGAGIGNLLGTQVGGRLSDRLLLRSRRLRGGIPRSEDRLTANIWIAGFLLNPLGLLMFGWAVEYKLNLWLAIVGFGIQCFGNIQVVAALTAYLVDALPGKGATVTAASNFVRMMFACILTIVANQMVSALGAGWTCTLFACLSCLGLFTVFLLSIWGEKVRGWSGF
ncbi:major facilitator superfamily domain-containing protein [Pilobolus umbonatus]|nr:major facilitator superfamily domain-containing protein [Pilobolus umbonatus]